jgi:hypothetical protein
MRRERQDVFSSRKLFPRRLDYLRQKYRNMRKRPSSWRKQLGQKLAVKPIPNAPIIIDPLGGILKQSAYR